MNIAQAITYGWPMASWSLTGNSYEGLDWVDKIIPKPTQAEIESAWAAFQEKESKLKILDEKISEGYLIEPENFILALGQNDRNAFAQMLTLVQEGLSLALIDNDTPQIIADKNGLKHTITTLRFRQIMVAYGTYYKSLWDEYGS